MKDKIFLIIGGAGFIGSNFVSKILNEGGKVYLWDNFSRNGNNENIENFKSHHNLIKIIRADYLKNEDLMKELIEKCDCIFHLAAQVAVTTSVSNPLLDFENNILGTFKLLEKIRVSKNKPILIYASTNKVYGDLKNLSTILNEEINQYEYANIEGVNEDRNLDFYTPYGCSKGSADQYVLDYSRIYNLRTVVVRQSCIYGENQFGVEDQGWIACLAIQALLGKSINIYGDGKQVRDILHVDDLFEFWKLAYEKIDISNGKAYNIGGGPSNKMSIINLINKLKREVNDNISINFNEWRPGDQKIYVSDISKAEKDLGWKPKINVDDGCKLLFSWIRKNKNKIKSVLF